MPVLVYIQSTARGGPPQLVKESIHFDYKPSSLVPRPSSAASEAMSHDRSKHSQTPSIEADARLELPRERVTRGDRSTVDSCLAPRTHETEAVPTFPSLTYNRDQPTIPRRRLERSATREATRRSVFSFGPCTARFLFLKRKRKWGVQTGRVTLHSPRPHRGRS